MQYTAGQAAEATGKNIATITRAIKSGKISAKKDFSGAWRIDPSELSRVYPLRADVLRNDGENPSAQVASMESKSLMEELAVLRERASAQSALLEERSKLIEDLKEDRDRWRQQACNLLADLRDDPIRSQGSKRWSWWPFNH